MNARLILAHIAMFSVALIYAANFTLAKIAMPAYIGAYAFILLRAAAAVLLFWLSSLFVRERVQRQDFGLIALCGVFGVALNQMTFFKGLELTTPINGALIMLTTPILVLVFSIFALGERLNGFKIGGIVLGLGGALLLILYNNPQAVANAPNPMLGNILVGINAASYGIYLIIVKPLVKKYHPVTLLKWTFGFGLLYVFPFSIAQAMEIDWASFPANIWWIVGFVLVFVTYLTYLLNGAALTIVAPSVVGAYIYLQPLLTGLIAVATKQDSLDGKMLFAAILIFSGVFLVSYQKGKAEK